MTWLDDTNTQLGGNLSHFQIELCYVINDAFETLMKLNSGIFDKCMKLQILLPE